jgi:signal transduction histidine kinase
MYRFLRLLLSLICLVAMPAGAAEVLLGQTAHYPLGAAAQVLEDKDGRLTLGDLVSGCCESSFRASTGEIENHGFTSSAFWYRVSLRNTTGEPRWFVEIPDGLVYWLDLHVVHADGRVQSQRGGATVPAHEKRVTSRNQVFLVDINAGESVVLYVRVASELPVMIPINLWRADAFAGAAVYDAAFHLAYLGFMLAMVLYNCFLGITLRDRSYFYYSAYFLAAFLLFSHFSGFLLHAMAVVRQQYIPLLLLGFFHLAVLACNRFTFHFLQVPTVLPGWSVAFKASLLTQGLLMGLLIFLDTLTGAVLSMVVLLTALILFVAAALMAVRRGFSPARFFLLGWVGLAVCVLIFVGMTVGFLPRNMITYNAMQIGSSIEALLFSFALGARMRMMQAERQAALSQLARQEKMAALGMVSAGVAHEINNPTQFTQLSVETARASLADLRAFVDSLLDEPDEALDAEFASRFQRIDDQLALAREGTGRINEIVRNMRAASRADNDTETLFSPAQTMEASVRLVQLTWKHVAEFHVRIDEAVRVRGRPSALGQVCVNLLVNACHAIEERLQTDARPGSVEVSGEVRGHELYLSVKDNGCGMTEETLSRLCEPFFTTKGAERGTGLGMGIVRQILETHGGRLEVSSILGTGTTMTMVLPVAQS